MTKAEKELHFIQLGLMQKHTRHFRHFIDQWFCFKNNYVNRNGNADWHKIAFNELVSEAAIGLSLKEVVHKEHLFH